MDVRELIGKHVAADTQTRFIGIGFTLPDTLVSFKPSTVGQLKGKAVEKAVINLISGDDKDDDKDDKKGGIFSLFGGDKKDDDDDKDKGGFFSFGDDKEKDKDHSGFFSKLLDRDDDDDKPKRSGFKGLFSEQEGAGCSGGDEGEGAGGGGAKSVGVSDGDLLDDLMDVAEEQSRGE